MLCCWLFSRLFEVIRVGCVLDENSWIIVNLKVSGKYSILRKVIAGEIIVRLMKMCL